MIQHKSHLHKASVHAKLENRLCFGPAKHRPEYISSSASAATGILSIFRKESYSFHLPKFEIGGNQLNGCDENSTHAPSGRSKLAEPHHRVLRWLPTFCQYTCQ